jgi:hypothetical protein
VRSTEPFEVALIRAFSRSMKDSTARRDHRRAETETTDKSPLSGIKGAIRRSADALLRAQHTRWLLVL